MIFIRLLVVFLCVLLSLVHRVKWNVVSLSPQSGQVSLLYIFCM
jgi:hypothetical protein